EVRDLVVDGGADEDDALLEEPRVDVEGALTPACVFHDHRDEVVGWVLRLVHVGHKRHSRHALPRCRQLPDGTTSSSRSRTRLRRSRDAKYLRAVRLCLRLSSWPLSSSSWAACSRSIRSIAWADSSCSSRTAWR